MRTIRAPSGLSILALLLAPFLVGFGVPDSTGVCVQVSGMGGGSRLGREHGFSLGLEMGLPLGP